MSVAALVFWDLTWLELAQPFKLIGHDLTEATASTACIIATPLMWFRKLLYMQKGHTFVLHLHNNIIYTHTAKADTCELSVTIVVKAVFRTLQFFITGIIKQFKVYQAKLLTHHCSGCTHLCHTPAQQPPHNRHITMTLHALVNTHRNGYVSHNHPFISSSGIVDAILFYCYTWLCQT